MPKTLCLFASGVLTLLISFPFSKAFNINPLPATVSAGQTATLTWFHTLGDPLRFRFAKSVSGEAEVGLIGASVLVADGITQGTIPFTFLDAGSSVTIVAYKDNFDQFDETNPKQFPFFVDTHPIAIVSTLAANPPINNPTSTTSQTIPTQTALPGSTATPPRQNPGSTITTNPTSPTGTATSVSDSSLGAATINSPNLTRSQPESNSGKGIVADSATQLHPGGSTFTSSSLEPNNSTLVNATTRKPGIGAIAGGVVGGVVGIIVLTLFLIVLLRRRSKRSGSHRDLTPFDNTLPHTETSLSLPDSRRIQHQNFIAEEKEQFESQLEAYENASQDPAFATVTPDHASDGNGLVPEDDTMEGLRHQVDYLKQRIVALEAEMAPPDYSSRNSTVTTV